jgi:hypothetical protein
LWRGQAAGVVDGTLGICLVVLNCGEARRFSGRTQLAGGNELEQLWCGEGSGFVKWFQPMTRGVFQGARGQLGELSWDCFDARSARGLMEGLGLSSVLAALARQKGSSQDLFVVRGCCDCQRVSSAARLARSHAETSFAIFGQRADCSCCCCSSVVARLSCEATHFAFRASLVSACWLSFCTSGHVIALDEGRWLLF